MTERSLHAYYDLKIFPESYNVVDFLYFAEIERIHLGLDSIEFRVVANDGDGFRDFRTNWLPLDEKKFRLNHIVLAAGRVMPSCRRTIYYPTRAEAQKDYNSAAPTFPPDYKFDNFEFNYHDSAVFLARYAGKRLGTFRATTAAANRITQWLAGRVDGRKPVIITLRNYPHEPRRNSDLPEWIRFADSLDPDEYCTIFLRDTADVFGSPIKELDRFLTFDPASIDIDLRLALYEKAYLNLFVETGPAQLCILDDITRCIRFKILQEVHPHASAGYYIYRGYVPGMQWPSCTTFQRSVWDYDKCDVIRHEFDNMVTILESGIKPSRLPLPAPTTMIMRFLAGRNHDHAVALANDELSRDPSNAELTFLLGKAYEGGGKIQNALRCYERLLSIPNAFSLVAVPMARCLRLLGKSREMQEIVRRIPAETDNIDTLEALADFLYRIGEEEQALALYKSLSERAPSSERIQLGMASSCRRISPSELLAVPHLRKALECPASDTAEIALTLADCFVGQDDFRAAIATLKDELQRIKDQTDKRPTLTAYVYLGFWMTLLGQTEEARGYLRTGIRCLDEQLALHDSQQPNADEFLAIKARLLLLLGNRGGALESLSQMHEVTHYPNLQFARPRGSINTEEQLKRLAQLANGRDAFILCHGPSIYMMDRYWRRFAPYHPSIFAVNRFRVFETGFLDQTSQHVDVWLTIENRIIKQQREAFIEFLSRDGMNILITIPRVLDALGFQMPAFLDLEKRFGHRFLYYDGLDRLSPPTPRYPLRFIAGNALSHLVNLAVLGRPRRIFIFGADGTVPPGQSALTHYRADSPDFGRKIDDSMRDAIAASLASDAKTFNHIAEMNLLATEAVFRISRPPIYNVSPDSAIDLFPRISYDEALDILANDRAAGAVAASGG